jgi:UrcA family protein
MIRTAIAAVAIIAGVSAANAEYGDNSVPASALNLNTSEGQQALWDQIERNGGN